MASRANEDKPGAADTAAALSASIMAPTAGECSFLWVFFFEQDKLFLYECKFIECIFNTLDNIICMSVNLLNVFSTHLIISFV